MSKFNPSSIQLLLPIAAVLGLFIAFILGQSVGQGNMLPVIGIFGVVFGVLIFLALDHRYWYTIPFALYAELPAVPLGGRTVESGELVIAACTAIFLARLALKKEQFVIFRPMHIPFLLFFGWMCWVWFLHPTGFIFFGSDTMGGRHYLKMVLGFCAFVILACQRPTSRDLWWIIGLLLLGIAVGTFWQLANFFFFGGGADVVDGEDFYSWHQILSLPAIALTAFIFARYKPSEVFSIKNPAVLAFYGFAVLLVLLSGKRMGFGLVLLIPLLSTIVFKQYRYAILAGFLGLAGMVILVSGQGTFFNLPLTVQRTMSFIPADWDPAMQNLGTSDVFRKSLREIAWEQIQRDPWMGKGYALNVQEIVSSMDITGYQDAAYEQTIGHALSGNWHNRWLGYWADFGFPIVLFYAAILIVGIITAYKLVQFFSYGSAFQMYSAFAFYSISQDLVTSHSSGHTALDVYKFWWIFGLLFGIAAVAKQQKRSLSQNSTSTVQNSPYLPLPTEPLLALGKKLKN
jgi:hypothetical protein